MEKRNNFTNAELAEAHVYPSGLPASEEQKAINEFSKFNRELRKNMTQEDHIFSKLMHLRSVIRRYLDRDVYNPNYKFSYFLNEYIRLLNMKQTSFAKEINLQDAQLTRLLHNQIEPTEKLLISLEFHSRKLIPAIYWYRVYKKQEESEFMHNKSIRQYAAQKVKPHLSK